MSGQVDLNELFNGTNNNGGKSVNMDAGAIGEPHLACVLLLDVSGSMEGESIESLKEALNKFKEQICKDEIARRRVEVAIVTFADEAKLACDFRPVESMRVPYLECGGRTAMAAGIQKAIDVVKERKHLYDQIGAPCHKPWIFMITDGAATSEIGELRAAAERIRMEENKGSRGHLSFWALGVDGYEAEELFMMTDRVFELKDHNFEGMFDWLSESMIAISQSQIGEGVQYDRLPSNVRKVSPSHLS